MGTGRRMSFIGTAGVVAQQGNQSVGGSAPTNVSIATGAAGDHDDSYATDDTNASNSSLTFSDCTDGDNNIIISGGDPPATPYDDEYGSASGAASYIKAYLRADGATSYSMNCHSLSSSLSNGCSLSFYTTSAFTSQDGTGSTGINYFIINHGGGRGGITLPDHNDYFDVDVLGAATNSAGTTNASVLQATFVFKDDS